jgi:hypothetical protein
MADPAASTVVFRERVSLGGRITGVDGGTGRRCTLTLTAAPPRAPAESGARPSVERREYNALFSSRGMYFFKNIPPGSYNLSGRDDWNRTLDLRVTIPPGENGGRPPVVSLDLQFVPAQPTDEQQPDTATPARAPAASVGRKVSANPERATQGKRGRHR